MTSSHVLICIHSKIPTDVYKTISRDPKPHMSEKKMNEVICYNPAVSQTAWKWAKTTLQGRSVNLPLAKQPPPPEKNHPTGQEHHPASSMMALQGHSAHLFRTRHGVKADNGQYIIQIVSYILFHNIHIKLRNILPIDLQFYLFAYPWYSCCSVLLGCCCSPQYHFFIS